MKKGIVTLIAGLLALTMCAVVSASEVGNISLLGRERESRFTLELQAEHLTRQMDLKERSGIATQVSVYLDTQYFYLDVHGTGYLDLTRLEEIETIDRYFLKASLKLGFLEVYGKYGMARLISKWEHYDLELGIGPYESQGETHPGYIELCSDFGEFYIENPGIAIEKPMELGLERSNWGTFYGAGLKLIFYNKPDFKAAFDAQYVTQKNKDMGFCSIAGFGEANGTYGEVGLGARIDESQTTEMHLALVLSGTMGKLSPYAGLKYSQMETKYKGQVFFWTQTGSIYNETTIFPFAYTMQQTDSFGVFVGADYHFTDKLIGKFEIKLLDETSFSAGLGVAI